MPARYIQHSIAKPDYSTFISLAMLSVLVCQFGTDMKSGPSFEGTTWSGGFREQCEGEYQRHTAAEPTEWRISQPFHFAKYYLWKWRTKFVVLDIACSVHDEVWNIHATLYSENVKVDFLRKMGIDGGMILLYNCVIKIKFTLEQATKTQRGGIALLFL